MKIKRASALEKDEPLRSRGIDTNTLTKSVADSTDKLLIEGAVLSLRGVPVLGALNIQPTQTPTTKTKQNTKTS
jgi:hypothetical protein